MTRIDTYTGSNAFNATKDEWIELWTNSRGSTPYQAWHWQFSHYNFISPNATPIILIARNELNIAIALGAFISCRDHGSRLRKICFIGDHDSDYNSIIVRTGESDEVAIEILVYLLKSYRTEASFFELSNVPIMSPSGIALTQLTNSIIYDKYIFTKRESFCYSVPLTSHENADSNRDLQNRFHTKFLKAKKELENNFENVCFKHYDREIDIDSIVGDIEIIDKARWGSNSRYHIPNERNFQRHLASELAKDGTYNTFLLYINNKPVAFLVGFKTQNTMHVPYISYDKSFNSNRYSIGMSVIYFAIKSCIDCGIDNFDLTRGGEGYKIKLGGQKNKNISVKFYRGIMDVKLETITTKAMRRLRRFSVLRNWHRSIKAHLN